MFYNAVQRHDNVENAGREVVRKLQRRQRANRDFLNLTQSGEQTAQTVAAARGNNYFSTRACTVLLNM